VAGFIPNPAFEVKFEMGEKNFDGSRSRGEEF
jgi:hypothetical protein